MQSTPEPVREGGRSPPGAGYPTWPNWPSVQVRLGFWALVPTWSTPSAPHERAGQEAKSHISPICNYVSTACLLSSCGPGLRFWVDEPTKRVVRRPVGDDRALAACSTSLVRKASAGSPAGRRGDHLPLPVRDRLARRAQRFRSLADGVEAPPGLGCGRD